MILDPAKLTTREGVLQGLDDSDANSLFEVGKSSGGLESKGKSKCFDASTNVKCCFGCQWREGIRERINQTEMFRVKYYRRRAMKASVYK
jgi:hypothetical protein